MAAEESKDPTGKTTQPNAAEEKDQALPVSANKSYSVGTAKEQDSARPIIPPKSYTLSAEPGKYVVGAPNANPEGKASIGASPHMTPSGFPPDFVVTKDGEKVVASVPSALQREITQALGHIAELEAALPELQEQLRKATVSNRLGIGGNLPPVDIETIDEAFEDSLAVARMARKKLSSEAQDRDEIREAKSAISWVQGKLEPFGLVLTGVFAEGIATALFALVMKLLHTIWESLQLILSFMP